MPERTEVGLTQAVLKFAAGDDQTRRQESTTWYVRITRGGEVYILNRQAGGQLGHISVHKDGRCHYKVAVPDGAMHKHAEWDLQKPLDDTGLRRLATVAIPRASLGVPPDFEGAEEDTVLIPPPSEGDRIEVDILVEPGQVPVDQWPGQTSLGARLVGRFSLYSESPDDGFLHFTLVFTYRPDPLVGETRQISLSLPDGLTEPPPNLRVVWFELVEVDGQKLPVLLEAPLQSPPRPAEDVR
ncbi:hypothetical protein SAMN05192575_105183 [Nocardioides alpinus]|jgi:hypothetical protein|uniref:Uncharacterized protein n=1 Tax=Nocardioides alpinus TaxID=748909 RepID=A0A1I0ZBN0_9ACTN|nr:hypothetical protein [Nocardioides alpinus]PKH40722.1 hypothetical protein CXG46_12095 [Nocardioides alpinus]SFB22767.1 hypothetical protein SAMN05192575_105183 [Nocardioides alpinus]